MIICKTGWEALGFESYQEYLLSPWWQNKRNAIIGEKNECEGCGEIFDSEKLNLHHKHYNNVGNESRKDLMILCFDCHKKEHDGSK